MQEAHIKSLQTQNQQLQGLLDTKLLVNAISHTVTTSLKMVSQVGWIIKVLASVANPILGSPDLHNWHQAWMDH